MPRRNCSGQLSVSPRPGGQTSWPVQHSPPIDLDLWADRSRYACPWGDTYYQGLRKRANPKIAPCGVRTGSGSKSSGTCGKPTPSTMLIAVEKTAAAPDLGFSHYRTLNLQSRFGNFTQNSPCKPKNIFLYCFPQIRLYLLTFTRHLLPAMVSLTTKIVPIAIPIRWGNRSDIVIEQQNL
jgi:hypothetical protein